MDTRLRCPHCRSITWFRDGLVVEEDDEGSVTARRILAAARGGPRWSCMECGHEPEERSILAAGINEAADSGPQGR